jgi:Sporulation related domain.
MDNQERQEQFELFNGQVKEVRSSAFPGIQSFININLTWEKVILLFIFCLMLAIMSFSLGVEKGKRSFSSQNTSVALQVKSIPAVKPVILENKPAATKAIVPQANVASLPPKQSNDSNTVIKKYTVQIASLQNSAAVQREVERLKKSGYEIWVKQSGKYYILCVGRFSSNDEAKTYQRNLQKIYSDCLIRRI